MDRKFLILIVLFGGYFILSSFRQDPVRGELPFQAKEKLTYKIFYNWNFVWLSAGEVVFEVKDEGDVYHIEVSGKTYSSYEWFYKVRDKYHSYINKKTLLPTMYFREIQQGSYRHYEKIVFDHENNKATCYTGKTMSDATTTVLYNIENYYDMVSLMYLIRQTELSDFRKNKKLMLNLILDGQKYELSMKYLNDQKSLSVKESGKYRTINCSADVVSGKVFDENASMKLFIGDDLNRFPVMIESPLTVGTVKAILKSVEWNKYNQDSKLK
ncbi:MAG TPA: DUF3108 domain-containing protein [Saprospiraceae bacterium]|nr:DUF3108 domain-containing protein [Saprospiraceae bacterium]